MKIYEYFKKDQEVYVLTNNGLALGRYVRKNTADTVDISFMIPDGNGYLEHTGYKDEYGTMQNYAEFPERMVFASREAARMFLLTGTLENLPIVAERESAYDVGDYFYYCDKDGVHSHEITSVRWRLGQWEYHCDWGGAAVYLEDSRGRQYYKTREEAVEAYLNN